MKFLMKYRWQMLIAFLLSGTWYALSLGGCSFISQTHKPGHAPDVRTKSDRSNERPAANGPRRIRGAVPDQLAKVRSSLARRYLFFMLPGGRLNGESYDGSIVNSAFKQAWGVTARIDLSEEQQDRLAEFLLQEDWLKLTTMDPDQVKKWAKDHLSKEQTDALLAFIEEARQGEQNLSELRMEMKKQEYGVGTPGEAFAAEMKQSKRIAELLAMNTDNLSEQEVAKMRDELKQLMRPANPGKDNANANPAAGARTDEQATQFFHLLADRIPMTEEQQMAVYHALKNGATTPTNPYDYQSRSLDRIEADVRASMEWMGKVLTKEQYETYLRHYLAEIEMIRFQVSR
jgi:hypothetical protein